MSYIRFTEADNTISVETQKYPMWTTANGSTSTLTNQNMFVYYGNTGPITPSSSYIDITSISGTNQVQFSLLYGNKSGSGSTYINSLAPTSPFDGTALTPTRVVYGQYRSLLLGDENSNFTFGSNTPNGIFIINISRNQYKEHMALGTFQLNLASSSYNRQLIDDSLLNQPPKYNNNGIQYNYIYSGTIANGIYNNDTTNVYGIFYPNNNIIILNETLITGSNGNSVYPIGFPSAPSIPNTYNPCSLFFNQIQTGSYFNLMSSQDVPSHYFRAAISYNDLNYTTNPSIINTSGSLIYSDLIYNPTTFITTVGLYNDNNDLLAVAKLSRPISKNFTKILTLQVKLNY